jgi:hypothetical protein
MLLLNYISSLEESSNITPNAISISMAIFTISSLPASTSN